MFYQKLNNVWLLIVDGLVFDKIRQEGRSIMSKIGVGVEGEGEWYSSFCFKCTLTWCDLLDNHLGFYITAWLDTTHVGTKKNAFFSLTKWAVI